MVNRISGLASGMDIDGMVKKLMTAERIPLDKLNANKQILTWQRDQYRTLNSKVLDFRNAAFNMKLDSAYLSKKSSSSDDTVASVTASASATEGNYSLEVTKLAKAASLTSGDLMAGAGDATKTLGAIATDASVTLNDPSITLNANTTISITGGKGSANIQVNPTDTVSQFVTNVNAKSSVTGVKLSYDSTLDSLFFVSTATGDTAKVDIKSTDSNLLGKILKLPGTAPGATTLETETGTRATAFASLNDVIDPTLTATQTLRITYQPTGVASPNNYDVQITKGKTIGQLVDDINSSPLGQTGVTAYLDSTGQLAFMNPDNSHHLSFTDQTVDGTDIVDKLGLTSSTRSAGQAFNTVSVAGNNASVKFNNVVGSYATNTFTINGLTFTAKKEAATTNVTVSEDVDTIYNNIKGFVDKYNDLISTVNTKTSETRYRDFTPLTDEQKTAMKDDDIKAWQDKAQSGLLHNDGILTSGISNLRSSLTKTISGIPTGDFNQLAEIGITTGAYQEQGKLYIDDTKLKDAIANHPDQVKKLFTANDGITTSDDGHGLAVRLYDQAKSWNEKLIAKAGVSTSVNSGYLIGKNLNSIGTSIDKMNTKLTATETRYYNQFNAMETAINKLNSQSAQLAQFGK
ncbi:flagellar filament capping protein FliD [Paenibacillus frigoriresistens]|uniref:flagellar filament capping protein FliD n=1 Tax=Paenibacillus alginolyticus TaxID=59839 RepID=UPI001563FE0E|nr:flagellar filament capping protein FliD [Paenibacillus frigoriresistens]NRF93674.1 flagellar filament capping protein FliD [Paenibacillus frigoriresistens]